MMKKSIVLTFTAILLLLAMGSANAATTFFLCAKEFDKTMPDGAIIHMWGYAQGTSTANACTNTATSPGPELVVPAAETDVIIRVRNQLPMMNGTQVPTSVVVNGQMTRPKHPPVYDTVTGRVRSLTREAVPGTDQGYRFRTLSSPGFNHGTFIYQSGTHQAVQVQMGLYGIIKKEAGPNEVYPGVNYDNELTILYSEIDKELHDAVAADDYGPGSTIGMTSTVNYQPDYFLVNGTPYVSGAAAMAAGAAGETTLLRFVNAGLKTHVPVLQGAHMKVIAEDGNLYPYAREQYSVQMPASKTKEAIVTFPADGTYPLYDRALAITNTANTRPGGLMTFLSVTGGTPTNPPIAVNDTYAVDEGATLSDIAPGVLGNDTLPLVTTLNTTPFIPPNHGALTLNADGSFAYIHDGSETLSDSFVYTITNVDGSAQGTVLIAVNPINDAPVAVDDTATTDDATAVTIDVLANDTDAENDPLQVTGVTQPASGTVTFTAADVSFTPVGPAPQTQTFTYDISDGNGGTAIATVTVTVTAASTNTDPVAVDDTVSTNDAAPAFFIDVLSNDTDADIGDILTITAVTQPASGTVVNNGTNLTFTVGTAGVQTFTYTISDGNGGTATGTVTVNVSTAVNQIPIAVNDNGNFTTVDTAVIINILANDTDDGLPVDPADFADIPGAPNIALVGEVRVLGNQVGTSVAGWPIKASDNGGTVVYNGDGTVTYTPPAGFTGNEVLRYKLRDGISEENSEKAKVFVSVTP